VLFLHDKALREYGGVQGVKDEGLLQSALGRPVNKFAYAEPGIIDMFDLAAAYAYGLATNHAFNDGNKRTAWSSCVLFLKINGINPHPPAPETVARVLQLVNRALDEASFAAWLRLSPLAETAARR
jgi:death-on-curing protein